MIDLPLATSTWDDAEIAAIQKVIDTGFYSMGDHVLEFEKQFASYFGSKYAVMVNSGSSANLLAISAMLYRKAGSLKPGDEVIVPAVSWSTTYTPLYQCGLKLKFVDIDLETLNLDTDQLKGAITDKTKLIFAVNLLGNPNEFDKIKEHIGDRDITFIEDNCESMGARYSKQFTGTLGLMGTFSTFFSHHMATMEGGVVVTDDEELYHIMLSLRAHGWTRNLPKNNKLVTLSEDPFEESFRFILPGYNLRPVEMSGAIGVEQLKKIPEFVRQRRANSVIFKEAFVDHPYLMIQKEVQESSWFGFSFIVKNDSPLHRKDIIQKLERSGVQCRPIVAGNFAKNEVLKYFNYEIHGELNNSNSLDQNGFFVGNHQVDLSNKLKSLRELLN